MSRNADMDVVLGGCGYIGSALVDRLLVQGRRPVVVVDRLVPEAIRSDFDSDRAAGGQAQYLQLDLTDGPAVLDLFLRLRSAWSGRIVAFHLAGLFVKEPDKRDLVPPDEYHRQNVDGVGTVVAALNAIGGPARLVLQSSGGLERWKEQAPAEPYLRSKLEAENLVASECAVDWVNLRPVRVVGTRSEVMPPRHDGPPDRLLAGLRAARWNGTIPSDVLTDLVLGARTRNDRLEIALPAANSQVAFVHVHDSAAALCWAASPLTAPGRTYRVTTSPAVTFHEVGRILVQELETVGIPASCAARESETPMQLCPPPSSEFGWRPSLGRSPEVVRAAFWQYLEQARRQTKRLPAAAAS